MTDIRSLEQTLLNNLPWNKARIKFVARFLLALNAAHLDQGHPPRLCRVGPFFEFWALIVVSATWGGRQRDIA